MASPEPPAADGPVDSASEARLRAALSASVAAHGDHGLDLGTLTARVVALAQAQLERLGLPAEPQRIHAFIERAALSDLCLASACEQGAEAAWQALHRQFARRLEGFAVKRGLCSPEAEALVQDVLGDLASPPPRAATRTLLGTYDGSGSLFGWLSVVVVRRIAGQARRRKPQALEALPEGEQHAAGWPQARPASGPAQAALSAEDLNDFPAAFARAFDALTAQQRFALVLKHRDGRTQREIGALLGVGEARVSRIVSAALAGLVERLGDALGREAREDRLVWGTCAQAVARHLASCAAVGILPAGRTGACEAAADGAAPREGA